MAPSQESAHISAKRAMRFKNHIINMVPRALFPKSGKAVKAVNSVRGRPKPNPIAFIVESTPPIYVSQEDYRRIVVEEVQKALEVNTLNNGIPHPCPDLS